MGKKSAQKANTALDAQSSVANRTLALGERVIGESERLMAESEPARKESMNTYMGLSKGNVPGIEKFTAPQIGAATQQFSLARRSIENMPPGPARETALRDLKLQEAGAKTSIYSGGAAEGTSRLASMGYGAAQMGLGAYGQAGGMFGQAGSGYGNVGSQYREMASSKGAQAGSAVGGLGGFLGGLG
jgi:hypothetical protein